MPTDYITVAALKSTLSLSGTMFADDDVLAVITAASRAIDKVCNRRFYQDSDANQIRYYTPRSPSRLEIDDLVTFTSLQTDPDADGTFDQTWTQNTDFVLEPLNALADSADQRPYDLITVHPTGSYVLPTGYPRTVKLVGKFGWPAVPGPVLTATTLLANRLLTVTRSAPLGIVAFDGGAVRVARTDPQVMMLLGPYIKHRVAVG